jgi:hypothetical protein
VASSPEKNPHVTTTQDCRLTQSPNTCHWIHHDLLELFLKETAEFLAG